MTESDDHGGTAKPPRQPHDPSTEPPSTTSRPLGDAIPTPTEPGLDQPLPPKEQPEEDDDKPAGP